MHRLVKVLGADALDLVGGAVLVVEYQVSQIAQMHALPPDFKLTTCDEVTQCSEQVCRHFVVMQLLCCPQQGQEAALHALRVTRWVFTNVV